LTQFTAVVRRYKAAVVGVPLVLFIAIVGYLATRPRPYTVTFKYTMEGFHGREIATLYEMMNRRDLMKWLLARVHPEMDDAQVETLRTQHSIADFVTYKTFPPIDAKNPDLIYQRIDFTVVGIDPAGAEAVEQGFDAEMVRKALIRSYFVDSVGRLKEANLSFTLERLYGERNALAILQERLSEVEAELKTAPKQTEDAGSALLDMSKFATGGDEVQRARTAIQTILLLPLPKQREILQSMVKQSEQFLAYSQEVSDQWVNLRDHLLSLASTNSAAEANVFVKDKAADMHAKNLKPGSGMEELAVAKFKELQGSFKFMSAVGEPARGYLALKALITALILGALAFLAVHFVTTIKGSESGDRSR
jgi:hypothetical protein